MGLKQTTAFGMMLKNDLSISLSVVLLASVSMEGNTIAGESLTLICSITRVENITGSVSPQWIGPDGTQVTSSRSITVGVPVTSGATTTLNLQFTTLYTSNGGQYSCRGDLTSSDSTYTVLAILDVFVQGNQDDSILFCNYVTNDAL